MTSSLDSSSQTLKISETLTCHCFSLLGTDGQDFHSDLCPVPSCYQPATGLYLHIAWVLWDGDVILIGNLNSDASIILTQRHRLNHP